jgi:hypothetical protein
MDAEKAITENKSGKGHWGQESDSLFLRVFSGPLGPDTFIPAPYEVRPFQAQPDAPPTQPKILPAQPHDLTGLLLGFSEEELRRNEWRERFLNGPQPEVPPDLSETEKKTTKERAERIVKDFRDYMDAKNEPNPEANDDFIKKLDRDGDIHNLLEQDLRCLTPKERERILPWVNQLLGRDYRLSYVPDPAHHDDPTKGEISIGVWNEQTKNYESGPYGARDVDALRCLTN